MANKIQIRRDTTANWAINDTILSQGELGLDINLRKLKIGDGTSHWSALDFFIGDTGPQGLPGADGAIGPQGEVGPAGATNELINGSHTVSLNSSGVVTFPAASNTQLYIEGSEIFGIDTSAVAISSNSVVVINTYDPTLHSWEFGNNGTLTIPGDINTNGSQITGWSGYLDLNIDGSISLSTITGSGVNLILGANGYEFVFGSTGNLTLPANSSIESNTSSVIKVGANLSQLETIYTDSLIQLTDAFTTNSDLPGYPWGITLPLSVPLTYDELILLSPETFPNQYAVVPIAHATNLAYSEWRDAAAATEIRVNVSNKSWTFDSDGGIAFPLSSVDLHNGGVQNAQVLKFNTANQQVVITGPTPAAGNSAERIIIQGQRATGNGEGGDVYLWGGDSDVNGGDIKIYAGDGQASPSNGGYVNIDGGSGYAYGGNVEITGGYASQFGGNVVLSAGNAGGQDGVNGHVSIKANDLVWTFENDGTLTLPSSTVTLQAENGHTLGPIASDIYNNTTGGALASGYETVVYANNWSTIMKFVNPPVATAITTTGTIDANGDFTPGTPSFGTFNEFDSIAVNGYIIGDLNFKIPGDETSGFTLTLPGLEYAGSAYPAGTEIKGYPGGWITLTPIVPFEIIWADSSTSAVAGVRTNQPFSDSVMGLITTNNVSTKSFPATIRTVSYHAAETTNGATLSVANNKLVISDTGSLTIPGLIRTVKDQTLQLVNGGFNDKTASLNLQGNMGKAFIRTFDGTTIFDWSFTDGVLTLPSGETTITAPNNLTISSANYVIIDSTGNGQIEIGRDSGAGPVVLGSNSTSIEFYGNLGLHDGKYITFPDTTIQSTAYQKVAVPAHSYGVTGDKAGMVAFDADYMYYCTANYVDDTTNIWKRTAYGTGTW